MCVFGNLSAYRYIIASLPQWNLLIFMYIICIEQQRETILHVSALKFPAKEKDSYLFGMQTSPQRYMEYILTPLTLTYPPL